jgi:hypothetical protein
MCNSFTGRCDSSLTGCKTDLNCQVDEYCNQETSQCTTRGIPCSPCEQGKDDQCGGESDNCLLFDEVTGLSYCGKNCTANDECNTPDIVGEGIYSTENMAFSCILNQCKPKLGNCCAVDGDCPRGSRCSLDIRQCEEYCQSDGDCPSDQKCCSERCVRQNYCNAECPCGTSTEGQTLICNSRKEECIVGCTSKLECPLGNLCDPSSKSCLPGCQDNSDCPPNATCENGQCQTGNCQATDFCPVAGQRCTQGKCVTDGKDYCKSCSSALDCSAPNFCLMLGDAGQSCSPLVNTCAAGEQCLPISLAEYVCGKTFCGLVCDPASNPCTQGYFCVTVVAGLGAPQGQVCAPSGDLCPQ